MSQRSKLKHLVIKKEVSQVSSPRQEEFSFTGNEERRKDIERRSFHTQTRPELSLQLRRREMRRGK
jgi:hypothetical protein